MTDDEIEIEIEDEIEGEIEDEIEIELKQRQDTPLYTVCLLNCTLLIMIFYGHNSSELDDKVTVAFELWLQVYVLMMTEARI